ncbi:MAG: hypothetical protein PHC34_11395 [Candidatus Gastranaerophilales bacterium]|nr:hypothetical protein [Candidatus Gastranaerophilales bacterium]
MLEETNKLLDWLGKNQPERKYSIVDLHEILSIAILEISENNNKSLESIPLNIIEVIKESQEYSDTLDKLIKKVNDFKLNDKFEQ